MRVCCRVVKVYMKVLSENNTSYDMNALPAHVGDLRYFVLDYSNAQDVDFYAIPLVFLDVFPRPAADLRIGPYRIQMPLDWSIVIADKNFGNMEILELKHLNDRPFEAFLYNPIDGFMPSFGEVSIENIFPDVTWNMPKLKFGHILAVPLTDKPRPLCAFFVREVVKLPDVLDITKIFT
jgi:hypothetical protein